MISAVRPPKNGKTHSDPIRLPVALCRITRDITRPKPSRCFRSDAKFLSPLRIEPIPPNISSYAELLTELCEERARRIISLRTQILSGPADWRDASIRHPNRYLLGRREFDCSSVLRIEQDCNTVAVRLPDIILLKRASLNPYDRSCEKFSFRSLEISARGVR